VAVIVRGRDQDESIWTETASGTLDSKRKETPSQSLAGECNSEVAIDGLRSQLKAVFCRKRGRNEELDNFEPAPSRIRETYRSDIASFAEDAQGLCVRVGFRTREYEALEGTDFESNEVEAGELEPLSVIQSQSCVLIGPLLKHTRPATKRPIASNTLVAEKQMIRARGR
jgi:hypothetical protein